MTPKTAVLVLGMHRSGTSALARAVTGLGAAGPLDGMPAQPDNPAGFCEPLSVVRLNERILEVLGSSWNDSRVWTLGHDARAWAAELQGWVRAEYGAEMLAAVEASFGDAPVICLKDPRVSLFADAWHRVLEESGYEVHVVMIHRRAESVASSLNARNGTPLPKAFRLWAKYVLSALGTESPRFETISFDQLVAAPENVLRRLAERIEGLSHDLVGEAAEHVDAKHVKHAAAHDVREAARFAGEYVTELQGFVERWPALDADERRERLHALRHEFRDMALLFGQTHALPAPVQRFECPPTPDPAVKRALVVHYHLFKNAGTSLDAILRAHFGSAWYEKEFPHVLQGNGDLVERWIRTNPEFRVVSSHTATGPVPRVEGVDVLPVVFLRHPLDRMLSAYRFERRQRADTRGARLAKSTDFKSYVSTRLSTVGDLAFRNFQTNRMATLVPKSVVGSEIERALHALENLPFVGVVEHFDASVAEFSKLLRRWEPTFQPIAARKNVEQPDGESLDERLAWIESECGADFYERLLAANIDDMTLHRAALDRYASTGNATRAARELTGFRDPSR